MKTKKFTAIAMAAVMSMAMVATTAMSASAEELDTPVQEEIVEAEISTTGKTVVWNSSSDCTVSLTEVLRKYSNPSSTSMANKR